MRARRARSPPRPLHVLPQILPVYCPRCLQREGALNLERRALVVDDDTGIRILVTRILERHGFAVDTARDGVEAIERLLQQDYEVITLDLMMPRMDGFGVVRYLNDHMPGKLPHVIVMTAYGTDARQEVCPPVMRFVDKPFDIDALLGEATGPGQRT